MSGPFVINAALWSLLLSLAAGPVQADPEGIVSLSVFKEQLPEDRGCTPEDLSVALQPGENRDFEGEIRIQNLSPARCRLSRGDLVSIGISAGHLFYSGTGIQWMHSRPDGKILFHVGIDYASSRFFDDVYANRSKIALDFHVGRSGFFAGPQYSRVDLINPLIGDGRSPAFQGPGAEAGYQRRIGRSFVAEASVGVAILGPQYDIGILEGRIGVAWVIPLTSAGRTPPEATRRSN